MHFSRRVAGFEHIGSAHDDAEVEVLKPAADRRAVVPDPARCLSVHAKAAWRQQLSAAHARPGLVSPVLYQI